MFETETKKARLWAPIVVFVVFTIVALISFPKVIQKGVDEYDPANVGSTYRETVIRQLEDAQFDDAEGFFDAMMTIASAVASITAFFVYPLAASAIGASIGMLFINAIFGIKSKYRAVFAVYIYTAVVPALFTLLELALTDFSLPAPFGIRLYDALGAALCGLGLYMAIKKNAPDTKPVKAGLAAGLSAVVAYFLAFAVMKGFGAVMPVVPVQIT